MEIVKPGSQFDIIGRRRAAFVISSLLMVAAIVLAVVPGIRLGVEFRGGWEIELAFGKPFPVEEMRGVLGRVEGGSLGGVEIQQLGEPRDGSYLIRGTGEADEEAIVSRIETALASRGAPEVLRFESVGARVGRDLLKQAVFALLVALGGIFVYVALRFNWRFAPGAVIALVHDVLVANGVIILLGHEFTLPVLAALLALIGFSTNDTVVVYDRIRENMRRRRRPAFEKLINVSLNEILGRTIITSGALLVAGLALLLLGGPVLRDFAITFSVGVVAGTYSSIFVAGAISLEIERRWPAARF